MVIRTQCCHHVAVLTIDNPPMNVLSVEVASAIRDALTALERNGSVLAVVITGAGERAFMAGADIKQFTRAMEEGMGESLSNQLSGVLSAVATFPRPTIAALNGWTLGGGCELALACDFRIAEVQVKIGLPEVKLGIIPGAGGTQRLAHLVGLSRAKEMIFTGEPIDADEAFRIGLVNRVVQTGTVLAESLRFAEVFRERSTQAVTRAKQAIDAALDMPLTDALRNESRLFGETFQTLDAREGVSAFLEKRPANVSHR